jgi:hypothetical protein
MTLRPVPFDRSFRDSYLHYRDIYGFRLHGLQKDNTPCHGCQLGKSHCLPFPPSSKHAEVPLEIVHSDLVGPFQTNSIQGNKYFATFIDD